MKKNIFLSTAFIAVGLLFHSCSSTSLDDIKTGKSFPKTEKEAIVDMSKKEKEAFEYFQGQRTKNFALDYNVSDTKIIVDYENISYSSRSNEYSAPASIQWKQKPYFLTLEHDIVKYTGAFILYEKKDGHVYIEFIASRCNDFARKCDEKFCKNLKDL